MDTRLRTHFRPAFRLELSRHLQTHKGTPLKVRSLSSHGSLTRLQTTGRSSQNFLSGARRERTVHVKYAGILSTRHPCLTPQPCTIPGILPHASLTLVFYCSNDSKSLCWKALGSNAYKGPLKSEKKHHFCK